MKISQAVPTNTPAVTAVLTKPGYPHNTPETSSTRERWQPGLLLMMSSPGR